MRHPARLPATLLFLLVQLVAAPAQAADGAGILCQLAAAQAERQNGVPDQLLNAISRVETGRYDQESGTVRGWPWTINAQGRGHFYETKAEAVAAAQAFEAAGIQSIDVGCMQINLAYHPHGFANLEEAFDPASNASYAARFLSDLFHQTGSWPHAAAAYHSQTPDLGTDYQMKVLQAWAEPIDRPDDTRHARGSLRALASSVGAGAPAPAAPTVQAASRPLGGLGRIIRSPGSSAAPAGRTIFAATTGRGLAAYRATPVTLALLPPRALSLTHPHEE